MSLRPDADPDDDIVENCRLWLADPLLPNWASRATVRELIDELDRLRAENQRLRADAYSLQEDVWSYQRRIDEMQDDVL